MAPDGTARSGGTGIAHPFAEPPAEGAATQVADGVLWMRLPLPMALDHVNVYALDDGDGWTIVDTGVDTSRVRAIWEALLAGPLGGRPVSRVLLTHHHPDHVGLAGWFAERGARIAASRTSWLMARMLVLDVQPVPDPRTLAYWRAAGMDPETLEARRAGRPFNFADMVHPIPLGFERVPDGEPFSAGGRDWMVRYGGGHAPDHLTLWSMSDDLAIVGDQILPGISPNVGVYATEPAADPLADWLDACESLLGVAEARHLALPGHKLPFTGVPMRLAQLIDNHHGALDRLKAWLLEPRTAAECFAPLFKRRIGEGEYGLALVEAVAHLNHLMQLGQVVREEEDGVWRWRLASRTAFLDAGDSAAASG